MTLPQLGSLSYIVAGDGVLVPVFPLSPWSATEGAFGLARVHASHLHSVTISVSLKITHNVSCSPTTVISCQDGVFLLNVTASMPCNHKCSEDLQQSHHLLYSFWRTLRNAASKRQHRQTTSTNVTKTLQIGSISTNYLPNRSLSTEEFKYVVVADYCTMHTF